MGLGGGGGYRPARRGLSGIEYQYCSFQSGIKPKYVFASIFGNFLHDFSQSESMSRTKKAKKLSKYLT